MHLVELTAHEKHHGSKGITNIFKELEDQVESEINQAVASMGTEQEKEKKNKLKQKRKHKYSRDKSRKDFIQLEDYVMYFFKKVLHEWEMELDDRPNDVKRTAKGRVAAATHKQTRQYMRPYFHLLKERTVPKSMMVCCEKIVEGCKKRDYIAANEAYMTMAIGNAAWPMGLTSVGIHERAGRAKIFTHNVAHVLNDEKQRKYVQCMKRLMSFHAHKYPSVVSKNM